jgi:hypothetical protein
VHAPPTFARVQDQTYADPGRAPDGADEQGASWLLDELECHPGALRCPDCGQVLIPAHDREVDRVGFGFLVCWKLGFPGPLPLDVSP